MSTVVGLLLTVVAAGCFTVGYVEQHRVVSSGSRLSWRAPRRSTVDLFRQRRWVAANALNLAGWGVFVVALRLAPLSVVQAIMAGSVGTLALVDARARRDPRVRAGAAIAVVGLVLVASSSSTHTVRDHFSSHALATFSLAALGCVLIAIALPTRRRGITLGVASGIAYGASDVLMKVTLLGRPIWLLPSLVAATVGFVALQVAYGHGSLFSTAGTSALVTNSVPIAVAVTLLGEHLPGGPSSWVRAFGFAAVIAGAAVATPTDGRERRGSLDDGHERLSTEHEHPPHAQLVGVPRPPVPRAEIHASGPEERGAPAGREAPT
ncbi:MAG TPA: hypothetical protein VG368_02970 [Acidimicrobiales bacterium]|nr:hypothetical protein [Acidimicrobiales bacterium]